MKKYIYIYTHIYTHTHTHIYIYQTNSYTYLLVFAMPSVLWDLSSLIRDGTQIPCSGIVDS